VTLAETIETKLRAALEPTVLEVVNESSMHNVPKGSETHFRVVVVSPAFEGKARVARHQLVYKTLADEMKPGRIHALAITSRTPTEWADSPEANESPLCRGGGK
jgi:BolA protein